MACKLWCDLFTIHFISFQFRAAAQLKLTWPWWSSLPAVFDLHSLPHPNLVFFCSNYFLFLCELQHKLARQGGNGNIPSSHLTSVSHLTHPHSVNNVNTMLTLYLMNIHFSFCADTCRNVCVCCSVLSLFLIMFSFLAARTKNNSLLFLRSLVFVSVQ